jgi:nicotinamidase-related amidase
MAQATDLLARSDAMLVVVDVQERINAVMADQGHLPRIAVLIEACAALDVPVIATEQYPKGLGPTVPSVAAPLPAPPLIKDTFSCAREPAVRAAIDAAGRRQAVVAGIEAHVCVVQTALDLVAAGLQVHVPHDEVSSRRLADKAWALNRMAAAGVIVTTTESALFELLERCGTDEFRAVSRMIRDLPV